MGRTLYALARCKKRRNSADYANVAATSGLTLWFVADRESYGNNQAVPVWHDLAGMGYDLAQTAEGSQPIFCAAGVGGFPCVKFDGLDALLLFEPSVFTGWTDAEVFLVLNQQANPPYSNSQSGLWKVGSDVACDHFPLAADGRAWLGWGTGTRRAVGPTTVPSDRLTLLNVASAPGSYLVSVNNSLRFADTANTVAWASDALLGRSYNLDVFFYGAMQEMAIYGRALSDVERNAVARGLMKKYGIQ